MLQIDDYSFGRVSIGGKSFTADLIIFPDHVQENWWRKKGHYLQPEDLHSITATPCDLLIIGTGAHGGMKLSKAVEGWLHHSGIDWEKHRTQQACEHYNRRLAGGIQVIAALHLTC